MNQAVLEQMATAGLAGFLSFEPDGQAIRGHAKLELIDRLRGDARFCCGPFHLLHADIGEPRVEFRSHTGSLGKGSLQIVINEITGRYYCDIDRWSPYSDVVGIMGHLFGEVIPGIWRRLTQKPERFT